MPANLTAQYLKAEEEYRRATSVEEELQWLQVMLAEIPKHKGTDKLQADIKAKISKAKKELVAEKRAGKKTRGVRIPRQGAGTAVILGGPNAGKSLLLKRYTRANPEVAPYPFTTHTPMPGMMPWQDVFVQLVDTPPITADYMESYMQGIVRGAELVLLMVDLGSDSGIEQCQEVLERFQGGKTRLGKTSLLDEEDIGVSYTRTFVVPNKIDLPEAAERLELFHELCPLDFAEYVISAEKGTGLEVLAGRDLPGDGRGPRLLQAPGRERAGPSAPVHAPPRQHRAGHGRASPQGFPGQPQVCPGLGDRGPRRHRGQGRPRSARQGRCGAARVRRGQ